MSEFKFNCPGCNQRLAATDESVGWQIQCPACQINLVIPNPVGTLRSSAPPGLRISGSSAQNSNPGEEPKGQQYSYCSQCGKPIAAGASFCSDCGNAKGSRAGVGPGSLRTGTDVSSLPENVAAGLCYVLIPVLGIVFLILDRRKLVRFHALQSIFSIVIFAGLHFVVGILTGFLMTMFFHPGMPVFVPGSAGQFRTPEPASFNFGIIRVVALFTYLVYFMGVYFWIKCLISAFRGEKYYIPFAGDIAENITKNK